MTSKKGNFSVTNILGKDDRDAKLEATYDIGKQLGKGAFGVVRLATKKSTGEQLAVKSIAKSKLMCIEDVQDVQGEVAIMNLVAGHANVVTLKTTHEDKESAHLVMELCAGGELFDTIVEAGNFSEKKASLIFRKMVDVIHHCQELGVMHRDLKPENFLLTSKKADGELKLTDFGLSTFFKTGQRFRDLVGSPYYVAPEVLRKNYGHEADMWSLGVILYILLSGLPPFWGDTEEQIFKMVLRGHIDFKTEPWPKLSSAAKDCVKSLLEQDVSKRATAAQILKHEWLVKENAASDVSLDHVVFRRMKQFAQANKLKKMCMMVVGQNLSVDDITGLRELFKGIDEDNSGTISLEELRKALTKWENKISDAEITSLLTLADVDGDGLIDYNEFVAATMQMSKLEQDELVRKAFAQLDIDGSGTIDMPELVLALKQFNMYDDSVEDLMKSADTDGDGQIDYNEFCFLLRSQNAGLDKSRNVRKSHSRYS